MENFEIDLEIVIALLKKLLNYFNISLSKIDNLEEEEFNKIYKKLCNNKIKLEDVIALLNSLDFT